MKKGLIFVLFALVSIVSYSQISWNAKVGMNMSNFTGDMDTDMRIGFNVGVAYEINKFFIDLSGEFGLAKLADGDGAPKNMNFSIGVGYKF